MYAVVQQILYFLSDRIVASCPQHRLQQRAKKKLVSISLDLKLGNLYYTFRLDIGKSSITLVEPQYLKEEEGFIKIYAFILKVNL